MSRRAELPIDMASEQKAILGIMSTRQLIYIIVGGAIAYSYIPFLIGFYDSLYMKGIMILVGLLPPAGVVYLLGFHKVEAHNLFYDRYLIIKMGHKNQRGIWRKGSLSREGNR